MLKKFFSIILLGGIVSFYSSFATNSFDVSALHESNQEAVKPFSHIYHPNIPGFSYSYGNVDQFFKSEPTGYFYFDNDVYYADFTTNSRLYILRIAADFTCGKMANVNGDKSYDWNYRTDSGYIHSKVGRVTNGNQTSSSLHYITSWPKSNVNSETSTATVTTSFGGKVTLGGEFSTGLSLTDGVQVSRLINGGFELSFSKSTSVTYPNPTISHQRAGSDNMEAQWNFKFAEPVETTYSLETFYLFEVKNDGNNYQDYSFEFEYEIKLTCSAWEGYIWHQLRDTSVTVSDGYGLY